MVINKIVTTSNFFKLVMVVLRYNYHNFTGMSKLYNYHTKTSDTQAIIITLTALPCNWNIFTHLLFLLPYFIFLW